MIGKPSHAGNQQKGRNENMKSGKKVGVLVGVNRRIEVWRNGKLIDADEKELDWNDLVVDGGLNALCGQAFDRSANRPAVFDYCAIGTDGTSPSASQTALGNEVMRVQGAYTKTANTGECKVEATFNITGSYALQECGLFNANSGGTMYCRDTYTTKNVESGDTVKVYYTITFQRPS
jgi:hypothetical protein